MPTRILRNLILFNVIFLAACSSLAPALIPVEGHAVSQATPPAGQTRTPSVAVIPVLSSSTPEAVLPLEATTIPTSFVPTRAPTPVPLEMFSSKNLIPQASPVTYLDPCKYLRNRWDKAGSPPGTVVVPVMYHQVVPNAGAITDPNQVSAADYRAGLEYARRLGFKSITSEQLANFLENNAAIPMRSVLLIIDDLLTPAIKAQYLDALEEYGFSATLAYIASQQDPNEWKQVEGLLTGGRFELQAHGYLHNGLTYIYPSTPEEILVQEIFKPVDIIEEHSGKKPVAIIWPGGDYTKHAVDLASEAGYRLGFTVRNRGPVLFNWIPQGSDENPMNYPLLVLPRAWSKDVISSLDRAVAISNEAQNFAASQRETEIRWYQQYCKY